MLDAFHPLPLLPGSHLPVPAPEPASPTSPPRSVSPTGAFAQVTYPTASPVALLCGSHLPVPGPEPAYPAPCPPLFTLVQSPAPAPRPPVLQLLWRHVMITFFGKVHNHWFLLYNIPIYSTLYVAPFHLRLWVTVCYTEPSGMMLV